MNITDENSGDKTSIGTLKKRLEPAPKGFCTSVERNTLFNF